MDGACDDKLPFCDLDAARNSGAQALADMSKVKLSRGYVLLSVKANDLKVHHHLSLQSIYRCLNGHTGSGEMEVSLHILNVLAFLVDQLYIGLQAGI